MNTLRLLICHLALIAISSVLTAQNYNSIEFVENKGQWDSRVKYMADVYAGAVYIRSTGFTILQHNREDYEQVESQFHKHSEASSSSTMSRSVNEKKVMRSHAYDVDFIGASPKMEIVPDKIVTTYNNYFIGDDPSKWANHCRIFQAITIKNVYPNIDVRYYTGNEMLKYDIIVHPGADLSKIALKYKGVNKLSVKNKELIVSTSVGELRESYPYTYQTSKNGRTTVEAKYVVKDSIVRFDLKNYDPSSTIIIDPSLIFCSLSGSSGNNWGFTATYGPDGSFYGGGIIFGRSNLPSPGAFQTNFQGGTYDIGIIKLSPNGSNRIYATYIGGSGNEQPHSLIATPQDELVIAGRTNSPLSGTGSYPITAPFLGTKTGNTDYDIILTKLNSTGTALIGSRRIGGSDNDGMNIKDSRSGPSSLEQNYGDDGRSEVIIDAANNIYLASCTRSGNFYTTPGVFQTAFGGGQQDGVLLKFSPNLATPLFSSYLGGNGTDAAYVLALTATGDIYVAGGTEQLANSANSFPGNKAGTINATAPGSIDGFVAQVRNDGSAIIRSTFLGTTNTDQIFGIQIDRNGFPYVTGQTTGNWPIRNATYVNNGAKQFIAKLQPDLSNFVYSTTFGTSATLPNISITAFLVDRCENVYVSGWGGFRTDAQRSYSWAGTSGMPVTPDAIKPSTDGHDFYFFVLRKDATAQLYGSFFGQNGGSFDDHVDGGTSRFDPNGVIYQAVCANCNGGALFPTTPGAWSATNGALPDGCNLGMIKIAFNLAGVGADVSSAIGGVPNDTAGCLPLDVVFTDQVRNAQQYIWNFGDGTGDIGPLPAATGYTQTHTFTSVGLYRVMLIAIDPSSCNIRDTSYMNIRVGDLRANLAADIVKLDPCEAFNYQFNNISTTDPLRPFTDTSFTWDFGDGSPRVRAGLTPLTHSYAGPGTYNVRLILNDTAYCNNPDSITVQLRVAANVDARFETPSAGCAPYDAVFTNTSVGGASFEWDFGDPASGVDNTSTQINPIHVYNTPGTYTIRMIAIDPNTCNIRDTAFFTIVVSDKPTANFSYTPVVPIPNTENVFTNLSSANATRFKWIFGDGDTLMTTSRTDVRHQYRATGTFTACLVAFNDIGCSDTTCLDVQTIINPLVDVPNAFTPNSGGTNSVIKVRGFGIARMRFTIWNRWGQKVFESNNVNNGWDGKVNAVVQPMDVYAYTLDVEFFDGTKASRKGDITLLR